jgi:hypothetical protein
MPDRLDVYVKGRLQNIVISGDTLAKAIGAAFAQSPKPPAEVPARVDREEESNDDPPTPE